MIDQRVSGRQGRGPRTVPTLAALVAATIALASANPTAALASSTPSGAGSHIYSERHRTSPNSQTSPNRQTSQNKKTPQQTSTATARIFAFNDFHGAFDPPSGSGGLVNGTPAGGVEYLATALKRLRGDARSTGTQTFTVAAGDLVGGSPFVSAAFHDEPTIEAMNQLGLDASAVGNHEFDEGVEELLRLQRGGCHPTDGCADGDGFPGAGFPYLAANVVSKRTGQPILRPALVKKVAGVPVGFVGISLASTPTIVNPAGIKSIEFRDEIATANQYARQLSAAGVHALVLLLHNGGAQNPAAGTVADPSGCDNLTADMTSVVQGLAKEYGVVVSGHTHKAYSCALTNSGGAPTVLTSAGSSGTMITDIRVSLDRRTRRFISAAATNVTVENGVRGPDGSWLKDSSGAYLRDPGLRDAPMSALADRYRTAVQPVANRVVGSITADIPTTATASGESPIGDVVADGQLAYTRPNGAQIAVVNPGGIRGPLLHGNSPGGEAPGEVTYGECFTVQPFNNLLVTVALTGAQLKEALEQQFAGYAGQTSNRILQVSRGFTYRYDLRAPLGQRVSGIALDGTPISETSTYRVTMNNFLSTGGDGFTTFTSGTAVATAPGFDLDALTAHIGAGPVAPGPTDRITKITQ